MRNIKEIAGQRGTLLMEAIAMLGLIAMVTPTLYKKSAERMQEIQDINVAAQARNMDHIISTFIKNHLSDLASSSDTGIAAGEMIKLNYEDNKTGYFKNGYSSYVPAGYTPEILKSYGAPDIYVYRYSDTQAKRDSFVYYIIYPNLTNTDKKRAARVASLVGANGGTVRENNGNLEVFGTGGGWGLDSSLINEIGIDGSSLTENSLVITSQEPVTADVLDSEVFLYRIKDEYEEHNVMDTSLYMGGVITDKDVDGKRLSSIYNVRKLTLNTKCTRSKVEDESSTVNNPDLECPANVADLYIGKPLSNTTTRDTALSFENTGAAWIYGNLSALNESFKLVKGSADTEPDKMMFGRYVASSGVSSDVFYAVNTEGSSRVAMMDDFVQVQGNGGIGQRAFLVGNSTAADAFIGVYEGSSAVFINSPDGGAEDVSRITHINTAGGIVYIGDRANSSVPSEVYINNNGGVLSAGSSGSWIYANGDDSNAEVHILMGAGTNDLFTVGGSSATDDYKIRADSSTVGLRGGRIQVVENGASITNLDTNAGGIPHLRSLGIDTSTSGQGQTAILTRFTDITGYTYMGYDLLNNYSAVTGSDSFSRKNWNLAVAGSAYVDSTLAANEAWFKRIGGKELHAGFSSYAQWHANPEAGLVNADHEHFYVRKSPGLIGKEPGTLGKRDNSDLLIYTNSSTVRLQTTKGAALELNDNQAWFGSGEGSSEIWADDSSGIRIRTQNDSSHSINIQDSAMVFKGRPGNMAATPTNEITAQAGVFAVRTLNNSNAYTNGLHDGAQFYVDSSEAAVRQVGFKVMKEMENSTTTAFYVAPGNYSDGLGTTDASGNATVNINGSLQVKGNKVIHIASDESNAASSGTRAMFEVNPKYIQVLETDSSGVVKPDYSVFKVNPSDSSGVATSSLAVADNQARNTGLYVRKGGIEFAKSTPKGGTSSWAADEGYGYILLNRMVSNTGKKIGNLPTTGAGFEGYTHGDHQYDQYMVNPAYTSVMHDIKLTTRGGARLSDILPDYVLKGVYNLSNNCEEGTATNVVSCNNRDMNAWASPYVGKIPYASCPPGYINMTTLMPISFNIGRTGRLIQETRGSVAKWVVSGGERQADILASVNFDGDNIVVPAMAEASAYVYQGIYSTGIESFPFSSYTASRPEGWFLGFKAPLNNAGTGSDGKLEMSSDVWRYKASSTAGWKTVAEPLYFQQNTWLKTTVDPETDSDAKGWKAYMGFIYDVDNEWSKLSDYGQTAPVNNIFQKGGSSATSLDYDKFKWNLFPVPINTIEGHAMVYCYFDRSKFKNWKDNDNRPLVDQIDQLGSLKGEPGAPQYRAVGEKPDTDYTKGLNDSTLKYNDPW